MCISCAVDQSARSKTALIVWNGDDVQSTFSADGSADFLNQVQVALEHPLLLFSLEVLVARDVRYEFLMMFPGGRTPGLFRF